MRDYELRQYDYIWLIYYVIIYAFNCAFDNMQMLSTILLLAITTFAPILAKRRIVVRFNPKSEILIWYGLFFLFASLSYFWSTPSGKSHINIITTLIQLLVFIYCFECSCKTERDWYAMLKVFCLASTFFAVVVFATSSPATYGTLDFGGFTGMQRNTTGYILMLGTFANIFYSSVVDKKKYGYCAAICAIVSLMTGSRKIIIGYAVATMLLILWQKNMKKMLNYVLGIGVAILIIVPVAFQIPYIQQAFGTRMMAIFDETIADGSILARNRARDLAIILFKKSPIWGEGWNAVVSNYAAFYDRANSIYAHNNYLEIAADFGIIGLILFYWKFIKDVLKCIKAARISKLYQWLAISLIVILVLDWGQVTYLYLYMISIYVILFKAVELFPIQKLNQQSTEDLEVEYEEN